ncbi:universal stress protein [Herbaspirillum lusitanum]|uniref:universal stress protein n=1 Tax=Herbaspirillum lusitanum TaxID=213312 RepID=UPI0022384E4D|nr:universal stress protein [Herbaspirillum lusitanum]
MDSPQRGIRWPSSHLSPGGTMLKKILLATDGSELSKRAVAAAVDFAASYGSKIVGLAVSEIFPSLIMPELGAGYGLQGIEAEIFAQSKLNAGYIADCAKKAGADCEVHTVKGTHANEEILRFAKEYGCDSIFMASHGRKGLDKLMLGSETQKVLTYSKIPVLVFK